MVIRITRVYNVLGQTMTSGNISDVLDVTCNSVEIKNGYLVMLDNDGNLSFSGELKFDFMNYQYEILEG